MTVKKDKAVLTQQLDFGNDWESCIYDLFNPENQVVGESFFDTTIQKLNKYLSADYLFIARINEVESTLESVAFCNKIGNLKPISFPIEGSLCNKVIQGNCPTFINNVEESLVINEHFKGKRINSYVSVPLYGSSRNTIGVLTALFCHPVENAKKVESLMFMFSARIGAELEHLESERELKRRNLELLVFKEELIRKNKELDKINTELKQAKLKAEESDTLKSSFLANLSHEIRTPMNAIIGFTELLKSNNLSQDEKEEYLEIVHQNGNQLMRVMDALIDISKLQAKAYVEVRESLSVNDMLRSIQKTFSESIAASQKTINLKLYLDADSGKDKIYTHKEALFKVLDHLMDNAVKFTHTGEIVVGYQIFDDYFEFFVKDTGIGIPEGEEERIFDLFRQGDINNTREFEGNGIGLSIVKKYMEVMKGEVWAVPEQQKGALLKFRIPKYYDI